MIACAHCFYHEGGQGMERASASATTKSSIFFNTDLISDVAHRWTRKHRMRQTRALTRLTSRFPSTSELTPILLTLSARSTTAIPTAKSMIFCHWPTPKHILSKTLPDDVAYSLGNGSGRYILFGVYRSSLSTMAGRRSSAWGTFIVHRTITPRSCGSFPRPRD